MKSLIVKKGDPSDLVKFLKKYNLNFNLANKLIRSRKVKINNQRISRNSSIITGDKVDIFFQLSNVLSKSKTCKVPKKFISVLKKSVIYKDNHIIALNKPAAIAVQGGSKIGLNIEIALQYLRFDNNNKPKLVHRLDKDTSGVLLLARTQDAAKVIFEKFCDHQIEKKYLALIKGVPSKNDGIIDIPLMKKYFKGVEKVYRDENGKNAISHYKVIVQMENHSLVELRPKTGRTHQLRVHCKEIGHPIIGDGKYGGKKSFIEKLPNKLCLHASEIKIIDFYGKDLIIKTPKPYWLHETL